jgi:hypothetical protein
MPNAQRVSEHPLQRRQDSLNTLFLVVQIFLGSLGPQTNISLSCLSQLDINLTYKKNEPACTIIRLWIMKAEFRIAKFISMGENTFRGQNFPSVAIIAPGAMTRSDTDAKRQGNACPVASR